MTWQEITTLEPELQALAEQITNGQTTIGEIIVYMRLAPLVGRAARHPRLRSSAAYAAAYDHLAALDKAAKARRLRRASNA